MENFLNGDIDEMIDNLIAADRADLYGEPAVGRRFKGTIWMQGYINFP